jgi:hypothetical protein
MTARCIYHPAPMTKPRGPAMLSSHVSPDLDRPSQVFSSPVDQKDAINTIHENDTNSGNLSISSKNIDRGLSDHVSGTVQTLPVDPSQDFFSRRYDWDHDAVFKRSARYYGPTSFSAVFNENVDLSEDLNIGDNGRKHPANWPFGSPLLGRDRPGAPTVRMNHIVKALWNIPSKEICNKLLEKCDFLHHITMNRVMITHCIATLWSTFGAELAVPRTSEKLSLIADIMFKNEETPLPEAPENGLDWLNSFMGPNLRFEMLGLMFCFFGCSYQVLQDWDPLFQVPENHGRDRKQTSWRMKECKSDVLGSKSVSIRLSPEVLGGKCIYSRAPWRNCELKLHI